MDKAVKGICMLMELACIGGLAVIGLKRNNDAYKAEVKCADLEMKLILRDLQDVLKDDEINRLKKELKELKQQKIEES